MKEIIPEVIRACTPLFLATIGGVIGLAVVLSPQLSDGQRSSGIGLAGTAIAPAAGLVQTTRQESNVKAEGNARIVQDNPPQVSRTP